MYDIAAPLASALASSGTPVPTFPDSFQDSGVCQKVWGII